MKLLYDYLFSPARIIQLFNHQKDWRLWWGLIAINIVISIIKFSSLDVFSFLAHGIITLSWLIITAIIIDATAQFLGLKGELLSIVYWLGFANAILWLSPSLVTVQSTFYSLGTLLMFILNLIFLAYIWITLKKVYQCSLWQMIGIFIIPCISLVLLAISLVVYATQMALVVT